MLQLIRIRFEVEQPEEAFARCVADFFSAIGYSPAQPMAQCADRYHEAYVRNYQPFAQAMPGFMENYLLNHVFRSGFPFVHIVGEVQHATDPLTSSLLLALHYSLLIGAAASRGNAFSTEDAVRVAYSFARAVEHNPKFFTALTTFAHSAELKQSDGVAGLLRN
jgi:hypothetical protein